jgi:hypothetical protein
VIEHSAYNNLWSLYRDIGGFANITDKTAKEFAGPNVLEIKSNNFNYL